MWAEWSSSLSLDVCSDAVVPTLLSSRLQSGAGRASQDEYQTVVEELSGAAAQILQAACIRIHSCSRLASTVLLANEFVEWGSTLMQVALSQASSGWAAASVAGATQHALPAQRIQLSGFLLGDRHQTKLRSSKAVWRCVQTPRGAYSSRASGHTGCRALSLRRCLRRSPLEAR